MVKKFSFHSFPNIFSLIFFFSFLIYANPKDNDNYHPTPPTGNLWEICFIDSMNGWFVGEKYQVYRTKDGGRNWNKVQVAADENGKFYDVYFINKNIGFVIGTNSLYRTENGGDSWAFTDPEAVALNCIDFSDNANNGWIGGSAKYNGMQKGFLMQTSDSGKTWKSYNAPHMDFFGISVNDDTISAGCNSYIIQSKNNGANWNMLLDLRLNSNYLRPFIYDISFLTSQIGFLSFADDGYTSTYVAKTIDGGNNWNVEYSKRTHHLNKIHIVDANAGWVVGNYGQIIRSTNGDPSWKEQLSPVTYSHLNDVFFINSQIGWVVGQDGIVLKTIDGGNNWLLSNQHIIKKPIYDFYFIDKNKGYLIGQTSYVFRTLDGGSNWHLHHTGNTMTQTKILFQGDSIATFYSVGRESTHEVSHDSGKTWNSFNVPIHNLAGIIHFDSLRISLWNKEPYNQLNIYKTLDNGATWTHTSTHFTINAMTLVSPSIGYGIKNKEIFSRTTDGGNNWDSLYTFTEYDMWGSPIPSLAKDMTFIDSHFGWIWCETGKIFLTKDGGLTWKKVSKGEGILNSNLNHVFFLDSLRAWVVDNDGIVVSTKDCGKTWKTEKIPNGGFLTKVQFVDDLTGWVLNSDGILFSYKNGRWFDPTGIISKSSTTKQIESTLKVFTSNSQLNINFTLDQKANVTMQLYDLRGRRIATLADNGFAKGKHSIIINQNDPVNYKRLGAGLYIVTLKIITDKKLRTIARTVPLF